jgi:hypothetical protein
MGRVLNHEAGDHRYVQLAPVYESGGRHHFAYAENRELLALVAEAHRQLRTVAAARGFLPEPSHPDASEGQAWTLTGGGSF